MNTNTPSVPAKPEVTNSNSQAVEVAKPQAVTRDLFNVELFSNNPTIERTFGLTPILSKGVAVGGRMSLPKRAELAKSWQLEGKENAERLDEKIREAELEAFKRFKAWLVTQPDDITGLRVFATRTVKGGTKRHSITLEELPAKEMAAMQKMADAFGISVDEVMKRMSGAKPGAALDVKAEVKK